MGGGEGSLPHLLMGGGEGVQNLHLNGPAPGQTYFPQHVHYSRGRKGEKYLFNLLI